MPLRDESKYLIKVDGEPQEVTEIREKILTSFNELEFVEEGHKYFLKGQELSSVSVFAHQFEEEFNAEEKAIAYSEKHGETPEYWLDQWRFNNLKATVKGTQCHSFGESISWIKMGHPENIVSDQIYKYVEDKGWLIPTRPQEISVLKFWEEFPFETMHIVLPETRVYTDVDKYSTNYAGTFDLLCYFKHPIDDSKSGLILLDYKTNSDIYKQYSRDKNKMMYPPFLDLYQEPFGTYTVQLNCYQIPLEDMGLKVIGRRIIWLKDDETYQIIPVNNVTEKIRNFIK